MASHLPIEPTKMIAVHLNYRSRAAQRGRMPAFPSYFLKPPSSLSGDGLPVIRPQGCELLCFEGELAAVIGSRARNVGLDDALGHVGWYAAANDFGVYDFRFADRGSNVMSKGQDGFTPIGVVIPAAELDPASLAIRTLVNGEVVQDDTTANFIFPLQLLIADLSRFMTLEPGDVILTGTPANSRPVQPGDIVDVEIEGIKRLRNTIAEAESRLADFGAQPRADANTHAEAYGVEPPRHVELSSKAWDALETVSAATLTVQLRKRGIRNTFLGGLKPLRPDLRLLGYAYTLRYVPLREDVAAADNTELNAQKRAIETIGPREVLVIEARGEAGAGTIGDILATRAAVRGATGIVTDGAVRDSPAVAAIEIPTYAKAAHAAVLALLHYPLEVNAPVTCGGVFIQPGDVLVGDAEGVVVIPAALAEEVARDALEQEEREAWALERVQDGESVACVYPISSEREADFEAWKKAR